METPEEGEAPKYVRAKKFGKLAAFTVELEQSFNRIVEDWGKYLGDSTMSTTILDRLMHRSALLAFEGKS